MPRRKCLQKGQNVSNSAFSSPLPFAFLANEFCTASSTPSTVFYRPKATPCSSFAAPADLQQNPHSVRLRSSNGGEKDSDGLEASHSLGITSARTWPSSRCSPEMQVSLSRKQLRVESEFGMLRNVLRMLFLPPIDLSRSFGELLNPPKYRPPRNSPLGDAARLGFLV